MATAQELAMQQAASDLANVAKMMSTVANSLLSASSSQADVTKKTFSNINRSLHTFEESAADLARSVRKTSDIIDTNSLQKAVDAERRTYEQRISNSSHFFSRKKEFEDAELRRLASNLQDNKEAATRAIQALEKQAKDAAEQKSKAQRDILHVEKKALKGKEVIRDTEAKLAKLRKELADKIAQVDSSTAAESKLLATQEAEVIKAQLAAQEAFVADMHKSYGSVIERHDELAAVIQETTNTIADNNKTTKSAVKHLRQTDIALNNVAVAINKNKAGVAISKFFGDLEEGANNWLKFTSKGLIAASVTGMYKTAQASIDASMAIPTDVKQQSQIAQLGMSPAEFMKSSAENRRGMMAAGGLNASLETLTQTNDTLKGHVSSLAESTKFGQQQMEMFTNMGIKPSATQVGKMAKSYATLHQKTGMTLDQFNTSMRDLMESEDALQMMRMANTEEERAAIADNIDARYKENRLRGVNDEQTKAILKQQMKNANEKPLTRLQQAIKASAYAGAMGVAGGAAHIRRSMKNPKSWTPDEIAADQKFRGNMSEATHKGLSGDFSTQLKTSALAGALGQEPTAENNVFNTTLAKPLEAVMEKSAATFGKVNETIIASNHALQIALGALQNPLVQLIAGIAGLVASLAVHGGLVFANIAALNKNTAAVLAGSIGSGIDADLGTPDKGGKGKGKLGKLAKGAKIGGAVLAVGAGGLAAYETYDEKKNNKNEAIGAGVGTTAGAVGGGWAGAAGGAALGALGGPLAPVTVPLGALIGGLAGGWAGGEVGGAGGKMLGRQYDKNNAALLPPEQQAQIKAAQDTAAATEAYNKAVAINEKAEQQMATATAQIVAQKFAQVKTAQDTAAATEAYNKAVAINEKAEQQMAAARSQLANGSYATAKIKGEAPAETKMTDPTVEAIQNQTKSGEKQKKAEGNAIDEQLKRIDKSNDYLKIVADNVPQLVDLANKQLVATTLTEAEKSKNRDNIRKNNTGFQPATYTYI